MNNFIGPGYSRAPSGDTDKTSRPDRDQLDQPTRNIGLCRPTGCETAHHRAACPPYHSSSIKELSHPEALRYTLAYRPRQPVPPAAVILIRSGRAGVRSAPKIERWWEQHFPNQDPHKPERAIENDLHKIR